MTIVLRSNRCKCGGIRRRRQRYCHDCHRSWMQKHRKKYVALSPEAKRRSNARAYLHVYIKRGIIHPQPCETCGTGMNVHGHHEDYSKPLEVRWQCRKCHLLKHGKQVDKLDVAGAVRNVPPASLPEVG